MTDEDQYSFYQNSVAAKAAYLTNEQGRIVARAIIFTKVHDCDNPDVTLRLCERQYSTDGDEVLKQILVNKLIEGGYIDGYKRVGADCHSPRNFIANDGSDLSDCRFYIDCTLDFDDTLSYQDTFKWYNMDLHRAYNTSAFRYQYDLATTSSALDDDRNWDEYHQEYTSNDTVEVYYNGQWIQCDEYQLEDFVEIEDRWYHEDEVHTCEYCYENYFGDGGCYSDITDQYYCCDDCQEAAEKNYCAAHPDEYTWIEGEGAVPTDNVVVCGCCGTMTSDANDFYYSRITEEWYCSVQCREEAEREYVENTPDCDYVICDECGDIVHEANTTVQDDGTKICNNCLCVINDLRKYNLF